MGFTRIGSQSLMEELEQVESVNRRQWVMVPKGSGYARTCVPRGCVDNWMVVAALWRKDEIGLPGARDLGTRDGWSTLTAIQLGPQAPAYYRRVPRAPDPGSQTGLWNSSYRAALEHRLCIAMTCKKIAQSGQDRSFVNATLQVPMIILGRLEDEDGDDGIHQVCGDWTLETVGAQRPVPCGGYVDALKELVKERPGTWLSSAPENVQFLMDTLAPCTDLAFHGPRGVQPGPLSRVQVKVPASYATGSFQVLRDAFFDDRTNPGISRLLALPDRPPEPKRPDIPSGKPEDKRRESLE